MNDHPTDGPRMRLDGHTEIPPTHVAAVVTYLEMHEPPAPGTGGVLPLEAIGADLTRYRALFTAVGSPWLWFSRARMPDRELADILGDPDVEALAYVQEGRDVGLVELDWREPGQAKLAFLGLAPEAIGRGLGRRLLDEAIARAFTRPIRRLWVHTCTLDHPRALALYRATGFAPYARAIEVEPDPRLTGHLPRDAAEQFPVLVR